MTKFVARFWEKSYTSIFASYGPKLNIRPIAFSVKTKISLKSVD
jgi:hypothetical protein